jgi:hypothetical protein
LDIKKQKNKHENEAVGGMVLNFISPTSALKCNQLQMLH